MPSATGTDTAKYIVWSHTGPEVRYFDIYRRADSVTASITTSDIVAKVAAGSNHFIDIRPNAPEWYWVKAVSWAGKSSAFSNTITALATETDTGEPNGFPNRTSSVLTWDNATRTLSISPAGTFFNYYFKGVKATVTAAVTVQVPNTSVFSYIYFSDAAGTLVSTSSFTDAQLVTIIEDNTLVAGVYYNTAGSTTYFGDERHGISLPGPTHSYEHFTEGFTLFSGGALNTITADASGATNDHAQFGIDAGTARDEDIVHTLSAVLSTTGCEIWYKSGANGDWVSTTNAGYSFLVSGTPLLQYNQWTGAVWQLTEVTNNQFALIHIFATNQVTNQYVSILGETEYTTLASARIGAATEISTISQAGLPDREYVPVATVILQTSGAYGNTPKVRVRSYTSTEDYIDWRGQPLVPGAGPTDHGSLSGLSDDDHQQYLLLAGRGGQIIDDSLTISGAVTLNNNLSVSGALTVDGATTLKSTLDVSGATTIHNTLHASGAVTLGATLVASGAVSINNTLAVSGTLTVDGATTLKSTLDVSGATTIHNTLHASGAVTLGSTLAVSGALSVNNAANISGALTVDGATVLKSTLTVSGACTLNSTLAVTGAVTLGSTLTVSGALSVNDAANISGALTVDGATVLKSSLTVSGACTINNALNISGDLTMQGGNGFQNTAAGSITINGNLNPTADNTYSMGKTSMSYANMFSVAKDTFYDYVHSYIEMTAQASNPATPLTGGIIRLFAKDTGGVTKFCMIDTAGTVTQFGSGGGGASLALDNLDTVAINTSLVSDTNVTDDLGTTSVRWRNAYVKELFIGTGSTTTGIFQTGTPPYIFMNGHYVPQTTNTWDLGNGSYYWSAIYVTTAVFTKVLCGTSTTYMSQNGTELQFVGDVDFQDNIVISGNMSVGGYEALSANQIINASKNWTDAGDAVTRTGVYLTPTMTPAAQQWGNLVGLGGYAVIKSVNKIGNTIGLAFGPYCGIGNSAGVTSTQTVNSTAVYTKTYGIQTWGARGYSGAFMAQEIYGIYVKAAQNDGAMTKINCSSAFTIEVKDSDTLGGSGSIGKLYGIHIEGMTRGATNRQLALDGYQSASDGIWLNENGSSLHLFASSTGDLHAQNLGTTTGSYMLYNTTTKEVGYQSSSRRYKENIRDFNDDWEKILNIGVKIYSRKDCGTVEVGLIAEDLIDAGLDHLVGVVDGEPEYIDYPKISLYLLELVREQQGRIDKLEERLNGLERKKNSDT